MRKKKEKVTERKFWHKLVNDKIWQINDNSLKKFAKTFFSLFFVVDFFISIYLFINCPFFLRVASDLSIFYFSL